MQKMTIAQEQAHACAGRDAGSRSSSWILFAARSKRSNMGAHLSRLNACAVIV